MKRTDAIRWVRRGMVVVCAGAALFACGSSRTTPKVEQGPGDTVGYKPDTTDVVIAPDDLTWIVTTADGPLTEDCVQVGTQCVKLAELEKERCGTTSGQLDVVTVGGEVKDVICYPPTSAGVSVQDVATNTNGKIEVPQNKGNTVITFAPTTNGTPTEGDVKINAEKVAVIGNGVDKTIIGGNLTLESNNAAVRGVTVNGNVTFAQNSNNASLTFCKIKGNLHIDANDTTVANCVVYGNLEVKGNNTLLVNVVVFGNAKIEANGAQLASVGVDDNFEVKGSGATCTNVYGFNDTNNDQLVPIPQAERTGALSCPGKTK